MQDNFALAIIFLSILGGAIARAVYPFMQHQKENEDTLRALSVIPPDKLTPEQKQFLEDMAKPINFHKFYMFTAILGLAGSLSITLGSFSVLATHLPQNLTIDIAYGFIPTAVLTGWGGGSISNQLLSSKGASTVSNNIGKSMTMALAAKIGVGNNKSTQKTTTEYDDSI